MIKRLREKNQQKEARARRTRAKISGTAVCPRLSMFRSLTNISVQAINDANGTTLISADLRELGKDAKNTVAGAKSVGLLVAEKCLKAGVNTVVFDRGSFRYHGKVKALADGAREGGLVF